MKHIETQYWFILKPWLERRLAEMEEGETLTAQDVADAAGVSVEYVLERQWLGIIAEMMPDEWQPILLPKAPKGSDES